MKRKKKKEWKKLLLQAMKIAVGSSAAIWLAQSLGLQYAVSAGSITLLTLVTTKWETLKLSLYRLITFGVTVVLAGITIGVMESGWVAYGIFVLLLIGVCHLLGWQATISVNSVIGTHFLMTEDFGFGFIFNEFLLVLIGISIAVVLNLFYDYRHQKNGLINGMRYTEQQLQKVLGELAEYLTGREMQGSVWDDVCRLEGEIEEFVRDACEYQDNTFQSHPGYYIDYFEMRLRQFGVLHNLHYEIKKIRSMPRQAKIVSDYIVYMAPYVVETNSPEAQIRKLEEMFAEMKEEPLPATREEFEGRAVLYHILMDLEEFLVFKKRFVESLDKKQMERYWKKERAGTTAE